MSKSIDPQKMGNIYDIMGRITKAENEELMICLEKEKLIQRLSRLRMKISELKAKLKIARKEATNE